jgi:hypothetical protein
VIRNTYARNLLPVVYDLTERESEKFYRGSGRAAVVVDEANAIIACLYDIKYMRPRASEESGFLAAAARPGVRLMEGVMSCYQFCTASEERVAD